MKKAKYLVLILLTFYIAITTSGCATGSKKSPWTASDSILYSTALALHGSDWMQTKEGILNLGMTESNVILGENPEEQDIDLYFASTAAGMSALSMNASKGWRRALLIGWNVLELICVMHNDSAGVRIDIQR